MCQMPNIWHIWHTKYKKRALLDVPNLKNYATLLQYRLKYETVRTTMAEWDIIILLHFSLSSSTYISLFVDSLLFLLSLSLSISSLSSLLKKVAQDHSQESCSRSPSRKLSPISLPHFLVLAASLLVLAASLASPHRLILHNSLLILPPHAPVLVDLVGFGFVIEF